MRQTLLPLPITVLLPAILLSVPAFSAEFPSRVERVVLYPDMAEVTRVVEVGRTDGSVVLSGLTANLLPETLSARVSEGAMRIAAVSVEDVFRVDPVDERINELTRKIEELTEEKRREEGAIRDHRKEKEFLESGVAAAFTPDGGKERPRLSAAEIETSLSLFRARAEAIDEKILARERAVRALDRKIAAVRQELDKIRNPRPTQEKVVRIDLDRPGKCRLEVTYLVPAAGFLPRYDARLSPGREGLSLALFAEAWQRTGEEWKEAAFSFSTARPGLMSQLPPLPPWELDFFRPPIVRPMTDMRMKGRGDFAAAPSSEAKEEEASLPLPAMRFASFDVTLEGRHALGGSGEKKTFLLVRQEQRAKVSWRAIPKTVDGAFLAADGRNETGLPVFAAPVTLFLEDAHVGSGRLPDIPEGEEFTIDFGKDPSVQVKRKELMRRREDGGVFSRVKRVRFRYEITAQNFRKETVPLTVLDQLPVPRHKEIAIRDVEITGGGKEGESGEVKWEFPLAAGEKKVLGLSFTVEYPADKEIHGL